MCQRPAASRLTVTVDGSAPWGSGRDHTIASGAVILASQTWPSRYQEPGRGERRRRPRPFPGLERRVLPPLAPEIHVGVLQMLQTLLQGDVGHLIQPRRIRVVLPPGEHPAGLRERDPLLFPGPRPGPLGQRPVVHIAHRTECPVQQAGLSRGRVEAVLVRPLHHPPAHAEFLPWCCLNRAAPRRANRNVGELSVPASGQPVWRD